MTEPQGKAGEAERLAALLRDVATELEGVEGQQGWLAALRFGVAGGLADHGEPELAEAGFRRILADTPTHLWAWVGRISLAMTEGDTGRAAALGREALGHLPSEALLRRKTAEAVEAAEGAAAAIEVLRVRPVNTMSADDLVYAIGLHRAARTVEGAADLCERLISLCPDAEMAHLARIEIGLHSGDATAAVAAAEAALTHHADHAEIVLRAAQAYRLAGRAARAADLASTAPHDSRFAPSFLVLRAEIAGEEGQSALALSHWSAVKAFGLPDLDAIADTALHQLASASVPETSKRPQQELETARPEPQEIDSAALYAALEQALAEGADTVDDLLARLVNHTVLPWYLAFRLVERLWHSGGANEAAKLSEAFATRAWSDTDRQAFEIENRLLRYGPFAALDWVRAHPVGRRDREACERLARLLLAAGAGALAARYLRACCRRWPFDGALLRQTSVAMVSCGDAGGITGLVENLGASAPEADRLACRVMAAMAEGEPKVASAACREAAQAGTMPLPRGELIEAQLLSGDLAAAEEVVGNMTVEDGPLEEALICRPRATRVGSLLNEARILFALSGGDASWAEADPAPLSADFFLPARSLVRSQLAEPRPVGLSGAIPDKLHVVWRGPTAQQETNDRLLTVWRTATRRAPIIHDQRSAGDWLRTHLGPEAARAHAMAPDDEQKADLTCLALLKVEGGIAVSAEQWPTGDVDAMAGEGGAQIFLDGSGGISMDALIAPAGHPLIARALDMAIASCLARENDHRWFKTGPGLMTRALARCLLAAGRESLGVAINPIARWRRLVHPCRPGHAPPKTSREPAKTALRQSAARLLSP